MYVVRRACHRCCGCITIGYGEAGRCYDGPVLHFSFRVDGLRQKLWCHWVIPPTLCHLVGCGFCLIGWYGTAKGSGHRRHRIVRPADRPPQCTRGCPVHARSFCTSEPCAGDVFGHDRTPPGRPATGEPSDRHSIEKASCAIFLTGPSRAGVFAPGMPFEGRFGWWRIMICYNIGVIGAALLYMVPRRGF